MAYREGKTRLTGSVRWRSQAIVLLLLLLGAALRLVEIGRLPAGLYHDEAQNGLDALSVLTGQLQLYFPANNGREPAFIYLMATSIACLGRSPFAARLPSAFAGILTLAATYDLGRTLWSRRAGRWALAVLAVTLWHVHLSRVAFRAVLLPLFMALYLAQGARALRSGRWRSWLAAGVFYGASWYTYMAARFTPIALAALALYGLLVYPQKMRLHWRGAVLSVLVALIVLLPLGLYTLRFPEVVLARSGQVSVFSEEIHEGQPWRTLLRHAIATAGMFTVQGDRIWRHNLALRPVWEPGLGLAFLWGLGIALARLRRDPGAALAVIWTAVMALPTLLAEDAPHFLRGVGVLPTAALLPTLGLGGLATRLEDGSLRHEGRLLSRIVARGLPSALLVIGLTSTAYDYFIRYRTAPLAAHWFESGPVQLAGRINTLRGNGWDGARMQHGACDAVDVVIDRQLWSTWEALPFLVPASSVHFLPLDAASAIGPDRAFFVWPYRDWEPDVLPNLPHPAYLQIERGPEAQGDHDPAPYSIATVIIAETRPEVPPTVATFEHGIALRAALVTSDQEGCTVTLWWDATARAASDYTVYVHYLRDGVRIAQHDGQPGFGHLRTTFWHPGDLIKDIHPVGDLEPEPGSDALRVGLYEAATGTPVRLVNANGEFATDGAHLPVIIVEQP